MPGADAKGGEELLVLLYHEVRAIARQHLAKEWPGHTLNATALVNELYLRLARSDQRFTEESTFVCTASKIIRNILVDYARSRKSLKRGGGQETLPLDELCFSIFEDRPIAVEDLDEALDHLAAIGERQARVVELRFFGGLNVEQTAAQLAVSTKTVKRDWVMARVWLRNWLDDRTQTSA